MRWGALPAPPCQRGPRLRTAALRTPQGVSAINLLGSVVTDPSLRGQGLASAVLAAALQATAAAAPNTLLWAERPELYARAGFAAGRDERVLVLVRRPRRPTNGTVRELLFADHEALHRLHAQKPVHVERSPQAMSGLLTTPGLRTLVLERDGEIVAYACTGKGADLHGHWHELGGSDEDVAELLPAAMHTIEAIEAAVLVPPYRPRLHELLGRGVTGEATIPGPMVRSLGAPLADAWIDGLDSV